MDAYDVTIWRFGECAVDPYLKQHHQAPWQIHLPCQRQRWTVSCVLSVPLLRNMASLVAVLLVVLGSTTVEMSAIKRLIIHGSRARRLAEVGCRGG